MIYAIQYNEVPSLVVEPEEQQMMSMVLGVLGVTIVILQRLMIRECIAVVEIIVRFVERRLIMSDIMRKSCLQLHLTVIG